MSPEPFRVSRFLRNEGSLTRPPPQNGTSVSSEATPASRRSDEWRNLIKTLKKSCDMKELKALTTEISGSDSNFDLINETSLDLVCRIYKRISDKFPENSLLTDLKKDYPHITSSQITKLLRLIRSLNETTQEFSEYFISRENENNKILFGQQLKFSSPLKHFEDTDNIYLDYLTDFSQLNEFNLDKSLSFNYDHVKSITNGKENNTSFKNAKWLQEKVIQFYGKESEPLGMSIQEFCQTLLEVITSKKSSDELQNELFELIGFDRIDLISLILEYRDEVTKSERDTKRFLIRELAAATTLSDAMTEHDKRPMYGCQVLVHSQEEKRLRKQMWKEEKKIGKAMKQMADDEYFEIEESKAASRAVLASTIMKPMPVLSTNNDFRKSASPQPSYPFVFDSKAVVKQTSGFIHGSKIALPVGFERKDHKKFEEVYIPASEKAPVDVGKNLIPIETLDDIGQTVFNGIESLNRIQSIVFDTAYNSSENMLVCAPTGAGKTNVALLCITQTIKNFIDNGIIKKDKFKIVYVAPMKALAAEMTTNFSRKLSPLGLTVKELTGDMQLTKSEILQTQMLVTTPEKWDVVTRKPGDVSLAQLVRLLIIDEVHLLHGDRGPVIEALVARTLRLVESSQTLIRIVGLSATLPNYIDVSRFLRVDPFKGLFFFDGRFRPIPLAQTFIGVKETKALKQSQDMNEICYDKVVEFLRKDKQVMVFVHARNATVKTALNLKESAQNHGHAALFEPENTSQLGIAMKALSKSRNKHIMELFQSGIGTHHAGMLRSDRNIVEKLFSQGLIKVLVCTATLAWGVNLPAHGVIIKGTEIYDAKKSSFVDIGILDVLQIFGRAGRPQFDKSGHGIILTSHDKLSLYLSLLTNQFPIESNFISLIADNLNAEVSLGTVSTVEEAINWLSYTYLFVRMRLNPLVYGLTHKQLNDDPLLEEKRREIVIEASQRLDRAKMVRYCERTSYLNSTDLGRTASHFYIKYDTVEIFNEHLRPIMNEREILTMITKAQEFEQLKVRDEELEELDELTRENCEMLPVAGGSENVHGKVNILIQTYISRGYVKSFSLVSDQGYVITNASRIVRALFEIVLRKNWPLLAGRLLKLSKMIERQMWDFESALKQHPHMKYEILSKLENRNINLENIRESNAKDIGHLIHHVKAGIDIKRCAHEVPLATLDAYLQPITRTVVRIRLTITPDFKWNDKIHGYVGESFWIWVEDPENNFIYHHEYITLTKKQVINIIPMELVFVIPIFEPLPTQYYLRLTSDKWLGSETVCPVSFKHLILPDHHPPHTDLLDLQPLPVKALNNPKFESLYSFSHFNPIQTQIFHSLYHTDKNLLLGAPTGSGKTIAAEIAMFKVFRDYPKGKVVYIAPLKALVKERLSDWKIRLEKHLGLKVVELTGDVTPDIRAIESSTVIITTPEKWDGVSRSWQTRKYVQNVALIVIDEIHLLGSDRGPVLEVVVSRTNFISSHTERNLRIVGLSTALANARDLADWLNIDKVGLYNFRPSVRPVPLEVHINGYPGKHYCPRMATMNKPAYQAIRMHSPYKPSLIFVSSRRQTRLTALDLISYLAAEDDPKMWLHLGGDEMEQITRHSIKDLNLRLTLAFGIGFHHAGLVENDRKIVEELYVNQKIQVLIATSTVAWGVNFPTHLVIIKGTEYYDGKTKRYVDMPITDVLQMMGRAGRPQFDDVGVACVFVHDVKKNFYKKFLYEPFPVESSLLGALPDHLNAEIVATTISTKQEALDYITWTYFFRRVIRNPAFYGLEGVDDSNFNSFLTEIIDKAIIVLQNYGCLDNSHENESVLSASFLGKVASYYYLSHETVGLLKDTIKGDMSIDDVLGTLSDVKEYSELPVRHNEDTINTDLAANLPCNLSRLAMESPHTKVRILLACHFSRQPLPNSDYNTDTKSVLDQSIRILQAMIDISADFGYLSSTLVIQTFMQMVVQARWDSDNATCILPYMESRDEVFFKNVPGGGLPGTIHCYKGDFNGLSKTLKGAAHLDEAKIREIHTILSNLPMMTVNLSLKDSRGNIFPVGEDWIEVATDEEYLLCLEIKRTTRSRKHAFAPKFPKLKDEGWFLVLGDTEACIGGELVALKRCMVASKDKRDQLTFYTPVNPKRLILTLYIMSDTYLGLDHQYDIKLEAVGGKKTEFIEDDHLYR
uniref:U5 small nuclear ribonucleoprotein 200 kDa helicase n=1 Tax=Lepeophtheirus salmonis TaxID=72036 RepID=A0A0K2UGB9_LEPSM